jgi:outer membrane protein
LFLLTNQLCRLIIFCVTFQMIILLPKAWASDSFLLAGTEPIKAPEQQGGKRVEFDVDQNLNPKIKAGMVTVPSVRTDQTAEKTETDLKKPKIKKLTLETAVNRALEANRGVADSIDQVQGTRLSLVSAESEFELKIFPGAEAGITGASGEGSDEILGAGISLQKRFARGTDINVSPNMQKMGDMYQTGVDTSLTQPLLRGIDREYNLSGVHNAEFGVRSDRRSLYLTQVNTVLNTIGAVYEVIRQKELFRLNEDSALRLRRHAEAARAKEKIGVSSPIDVYRAGIQQKQAEDNLNTAREAYQDALDNLKILLALPLEEDIVVETPLTYNLVRLGKEEAVRTALKNRVELDQSADNIREAQRLSRVAKHNTWPDLDLVLNYSRFGSGENFGDGTKFDRDSWNLGLVTSTDLARTAEHAAYDQSLLNVRVARRNAGLLHDEVIREVKRNLRNLSVSEKGITIQEEQIRQSKGQLELAQVKFRWGLANNFDLVDAETELRRAETNLLSAVLDYIIGSHRLRAALGTLIERPEKF